jgi:hypothetical protein
MLDDLLELFERDKKSGTPPKSGLRGRLTSLLGNDDRDRHASPDRDRRSYDDRDDDDDDRRSGRKRSRERDFFDFGD